MVTVTSNQAAAISAAVKASQDGVKRALNPADPTDAAAINAFLELSGKTPDSHPGLYGDLQKIQRRDPGGQRTAGAVTDWFIHRAPRPGNTAFLSFGAQIFSTLMPDRKQPLIDFVRLDLPDRRVKDRLWP